MAMQFSINKAKIHTNRFIQFTFLLCLVFILKATYPNNLQPAFFGIELVCRGVGLC